MTLVTRGYGVPHPGDVVGVITRDHVANCVAESVKVYPG
jgi:chloride channel protein, CIC family